MSAMCHRYGAVSRPIRRRRRGGRSTPYTARICVRYGAPGAVVGVFATDTALVPARRGERPTRRVICPTRRGPHSSAVAGAHTCSIRRASVLNTALLLPPPRPLPLELHCICLAQRALKVAQRALKDVTTWRNKEQGRCGQGRCGGHVSRARGDERPSQRQWGVHDGRLCPSRPPVTPSRGPRDGARGSERSTSRAARIPARLRA